MKFLLDTHVWLWSVCEPERLGPRAQGVLLSSENQVFLSAVSSWEAAIKWRLGKLDLPVRPEELVKDSLKANMYASLDVSHRHGCGVGDLPDHHRDPFDRLLIAQAISEGLTLLTADRIIMSYPCAALWALD